MWKKLLLFLFTLGFIISIFVDSNEYLLGIAHFRVKTCIFMFMVESKLLILILKNANV